MLERTPVRFERPQEFDSIVRHQVVRYGLWAALLLLAMGAVVSVLGRGPVSTKQIQSGNLEARYSGTGRVHQTQTLELNLKSTLGNAPFEIWLSREYLNRLTVQRITPKPLEVRNEASRVVFVFAAQKQSRKLRFDLEFERMGIYTGQAGNAAGNTLELRQWIYP